MKLTEKQKNFLRLHANIIVDCEPEHMPVKGNILASGDETADRAAELNVYRQLKAGNEWAWCIVTIKLTWKNWSGYDTLGGCSYKSSHDFKESGDYFPSMVAVAFDDLIANIEADMELINEIGELG